MDSSKQLKMPDFIIIGQQKCGTSALYVNLVRHPNIAAAEQKELYFFNNHYEKGLDWYRNQFPSLVLETANTITGEATPNYIDDPLAPQRVFQCMPNVKLIILLRNPVDRAYSQYQMGARNGSCIINGRLPSFEEFIEKEMNLPENYYENLDRKIYLEHYRFLERGIYINKIEKWIKVFPQEQMMIIKSEEFYHDPYKVYKEVLAFLNVPVWEPNKFEFINKFRDKYPKLNETTKQELISYFKPYNERLYRFLGRDLQWEK
ncbi:sulfotransferase domain-containing protein [Bacillus sp. JJ1533]|uniref:sulfotransferase domain-containing protein n=1 Tax=Bacillus sp. JJ1533 TaxID=3122959 RepID=UPI002FFE37D9